MKEMVEVSAALKSRVRGDKWITLALPAIATVTKEIRAVEASKEEEQAEHKQAIKESNEKWRPVVDALAEMDGQLRTRIRDEHKGEDGVRVEGVGEAVFPLTWKYEVKDEKLVPKELKKLVVDDKEIKALIKAGVRNIKGVRVYQEQGLRIVLAKGE